MSEKISEVIKKRIEFAGARYWANDNISQFIEEGERSKLIEELTERFEGVIDSLIIDRKNDPNSHNTGKRLAKMYINEIMSGRYESVPDTTSFPNIGEDKFNGMLVIRAEIKSICSHHHQPVTGVAYIGIIPDERVIGLSKYIRLAQWEASRGTLQESLCNSIAKSIMKATFSNNVAVYIQSQHGCCENRGIKAHSSLTQTTVLHGEFKNSDVKKEFFDNINLQQQFAPR